MTKAQNFSSKFLGFLLAKKSRRISKRRNLFPSKAYSCISRFLHEKSHREVVATPQGATHNMESMQNSAVIRR